MIGGAVTATSWTGNTSLSGGTVGWIAVGLCAVATLVAAIRWLRVAQREHYIPGSVTRFAVRWWTARPSSVALLVIAVGCAIASIWWPVAAVGTAGAGIAGPLGLRLRARTSPLAWTPRLRRLAATFVILQALFVAVLSILLRAPVVVSIGVLASPRVLDLACVVVSPLEARLLRPFLEKAKSRLDRVSPRVVAVTGSYGKTSTKQAIAHILSGATEVVASPASFNNEAGLARAVNEHLVDGTRVFVAEMGTYGPGEIARLCRWVRPEISVITAIGPVHLERFGSEEKVLEAKSEIVSDCRVAVLATDDERLSRLADELSSRGVNVIRCATCDPRADVVVQRPAGHSGPLTVTVDGRVVGEGIRNTARESNLACAVGVVVALGFPVEDAVARLGSLPSTAHRLEPTTGSGGATVLDDTYNSNPAGAAVALATLADLGAESSRRVVVTPGMVELGGLQPGENEVLGRSVADVATDLVVVGRTNRRSLVRGARSDGNLSVVEVANREEAVSWVRRNAGPGDVVLYENDLPDHYP